MSNLTIVDHPLIQHKLSWLRDKDTPPKLFRELVHEITLLISMDAFKQLPLESVNVQTPLRETKQYRIKDKVAFVPILRAALGMVHACLELIPGAEVRHLGMARDETTHVAKIYYDNIPDNPPFSRAFIIDPMLATGGSICSAIDLLKTKGIAHLHVISIVGAPQGLEKLQSEHPDVDITLAALDEGLNEQAYIIPGLGDAGDRLYNTFQMKQP